MKGRLLFLVLRQRLFPGYGCTALGGHSIPTKHDMIKHERHKAGLYYHCSGKEPLEGGATQHKAHSHSLSMEYKRITSQGNVGFKRDAGLARDTTKEEESKVKNV